MTAKVNLLPQATRADAGQTRQRGLAVGLVLFVIVGLGLGWFLQQGVLSDAEDELADARIDLAAAEAEVAALAEFMNLEERLADTDALLSSAMASEASLAGILQDIALVTPVEGAFTDMQVNFDHEDRLNIGTFSGSAEVLSSHAPGVERFLLSLEKAAGLRNAYPGGSTIDDEDIATFPVTVQLGPEYRTQRYQSGLPEELR